MELLPRDIRPLLYFKENIFIIGYGNETLPDFIPLKVANCAVVIEPRRVPRNPINDLLSVSDPLPGVNLNGKEWLPLEVADNLFSAFRGCGQMFLLGSGRLLVTVPPHLRTTSPEQIMHFPKVVAGQEVVLMLEGGITGGHAYTHPEPEEQIIAPTINLVVPGQEVEWRGPQYRQGPPNNFAESSLPSSIGLVIKKGEEHFMTTTTHGYVIPNKQLMQQRGVISTAMAAVLGSEHKAGRYVVPETKQEVQGSVLLK